MKFFGEISRLHIEKTLLLPMMVMGVFVISEVVGNLSETIPNNTGSTKCSYTLVINEVYAQSCPTLQENGKKRASVKWKRYVTKRRENDVMRDDNKPIKRKHRNSVKIKKIEDRLKSEVTKNRRLSMMLRSHEMRIRRVDKIIAEYSGNVTRLQRDVKTVNYELLKQHKSTRNLGNKLSSVMLDVSEVNHMLSEKVVRQNNGVLRPKHIPVRGPSATQNCGVSDETPLYMDCTEVMQRGHTVSDVYYITPTYIACPIPVWCDMDTTTGGWLVIQKRSRGIVPFHRDWSSYKYGFGDVFSEFWLGNDNIFLLTNQKKYVLRVDLWDFLGNRVFASYRNFRIDGERDFYRINVSGYYGSAGDSLGKHNGAYFSTYDSDHDKWGKYHCAKQWNGGWWYENCWVALLNGNYHNKSSTLHRGISWNSWKHEQLAKVEMKIRPVINHL